MNTPYAYTFALFLFIFRSVQLEKGHLEPILGLGNCLAKTRTAHTHTHTHTQPA